MKIDNLMWANNIIQHHYPGWLGIDDRIEASIREHLVSGGTALDVGCGKQSPLGIYQDNLNLLVGTDLELEHLKDNVDIKAVAMADGMGLSFPSCLFDLVVSKTVIEHMLNPFSFFREVYRVLRPGGVFVWATSNLNSLPMLVSRLTPLTVHKWVYRRIFGSRLEFDQFPTYYRANTEKALGRQLAQAGFAKVAFYTASWPQYFAFSRPLFRLFLPIHGLSDRLGLGFLQVHFIGVYRKEILVERSGGIGVNFR